MYGFSAVDGFLDVNQGLEDMIKYLANEPSAGLFYVQQHARNAMPSVLDLEDKITEKSHDTMLQTEDLEDSICCIRSMSECGFHIVDEMVKEINKSLHLMSTSQPQKGLLRSSSQSFQMGKDNLQPFSSFGEFSGRGSYLSSVFSSVKQKATILKWSQVDSLLANDITPRVLEIEKDDLPLSSQISVEQTVAVESTSDFEKFKSEQEAKLKEWLDDA